jgi:hypothetical protein
MKELEFSIQFYNVYIFSTLVTMNTDSTFLASSQFTKSTQGTVLVMIV